MQTTPTTANASNDNNKQPQDPDFISVNVTQQDLVLGESNTTSLRDETSSYYEHLLRSKSSNFLCSCLERIPLFIKLLSFLMLSVVAIVLFGVGIGWEAVAQQQAPQRKVLGVTLAVQGVSCIHALQQERAYGILTYFVNSARNTARYRDSVATANSNWTSFVSYVNTLPDLQTNAQLRALWSTAQNFTWHWTGFRTMVSNRVSGTSVSVESFFSAWSLALTNFVLYYTTIYNPAASTRLGLILQAKEKIFAERSWGSLLLLPGIPVSSMTLGVANFIPLYESQRAMTRLLFASAPASEVEVYQQMVSGPDVDFTSRMEEEFYRYAVNRSLIYTRFPGEYWNENCTAKMEKIQLVAMRWASIFTADTNAAVATTAVALIVAIIVILAFLIINSITISCFAISIVGPFARMYRIQDKTISKFIPIGLLKILKVKRITELQLGTQVQRNIAVLFLEIRSFDKLVAGLTPDDQLKLLVECMELFGPIVRNRDGYIDKYLGPAFLAVFTKIEQAVAASIDILQMLQTYNETKRTNATHIRVSIGLSRSNHAIIGTIGESERMDGAIISRSVNAAKKLSLMANKYNLNILVTQDIADVTKHKKRFIGSHSLSGKGDGESIFEILDLQRDKHKLSHAEEFSQAMKLIDESQFIEAHPILQHICSQTGYDQFTNQQLMLCQILLEEGEDITKDLTIVQVFEDSRLLDAFEKHSIQELSGENLVAWKLIQQFINAEPKEQLGLARHLYETFLNPKYATYPVNVTEKVIQKVEEAINTGTVNSSLFADVQGEVQLLLTDSFKRFKRSNLCIRAYQRKTVKSRLVVE